MRMCSCVHHVTLFLQNNSPAPFTALITVLIKSKKVVSSTFMQSRCTTNSGSNQMDCFGSNGGRKSLLQWNLWLQSVSFLVHLTDVHSADLVTLGSCRWTEKVLNSSNYPGVGCHGSFPCQVFVTRAADWRKDWPGRHPWLWTAEDFSSVHSRM